MPTILLYGAYGYTGTLTAKLAAQRGVSLILAGRNEAKTAAIAEQVGMEHRVFSVEDAADHLDGVGAVLHCAGPFSATSRPMLDACVARGVHYMDITGEIEVFEAVAARGEEARSAGIVAMPGVGFDVVPTDCMAAYVCAKLPGATELTLAFYTRGAMSQGTAKTAVENLGKPGYVRRDGKITEVSPAHEQRTVDFGAGGIQQAVAIPWGDVSTAYYTTGVGNITTMVAMPTSMRVGARLSGALGGLLQTGPVQRFLRNRIEAGPAGPSDEARRRVTVYVWGEARDAAGNVAQARIATPEGYTFTADASLRIAQRVLAGEVEPGFHTPAGAFGADLVLSCDGTSREDA